MYRDAADALSSLMSGASGQACGISQMPMKIKYLDNGIEYCFIEVTCGRVQYGIGAYGEEAKGLYAEGLKYKGVPQAVPMPLVVG